MRLGSGAAVARRAGGLAIAVVLAWPMPAQAASTWSLVPSARITGAGQNYLDGVSCAKGQLSARATATCFAAGSLVNAQGLTRPLVERWTGRGWTTVPTSVKGHPIASALVAVSCATPKSCMAVGSSRATSTSPTAPLIERWDGAKWSVVPGAIPRGSTGTYLAAVSCAGATACVAVGNYTSSSTSGSALVERWNGHKWSTMNAPDAASAATTTLQGVSCTGPASASTCWAVGSYATSVDGTPFYTVTERMVHGKWTVVPSPNAHGDHISSLNAVSCSSVKSCFAAGSWGSGATLIEQWNGKRWTALKSPNPRGFTFGQLTGISCASASSCVAAGSFAIGSAPGATLIEQWNGRSWQIQPSPNPPKAANSVLTGVSCVGATRCLAIGTYLTDKFANPAAGFSQHRG